MPRFGHHTFFSILAVGTLALAPRVLAAQQPGEITGRVTYVGSGQGVEQALVVLPDAGLGSITDPQGRFRIEGVPPGTYEIVAWQEKAGTQTQSVTVGAKETKEVAFTFERPAKP